jgi:hypothetical protein
MAEDYYEDPRTAIKRCKDASPLSRKRQFQQPIGTSQTPSKSEDEVAWALVIPLVNVV